jgi:hypothetical protein
MKLLLMLCIAALAGCDKPPAAEVQSSVSYKTRAENAVARVEKTYRLSDTESLKIVIVPGYPLGERCVVYTNGHTSAMQCRELLPSQQ